MSDKLPELRMDAYYYGFTPTGNRAIDGILSAVACAGKSFHHTESWTDKGGSLNGGTRSCVDEIQEVADRAAKTPEAQPTPSAPAGGGSLFNAPFRLSYSGEKLMVEDSIGNAVAEIYQGHENFVAVAAFIVEACNAAPFPVVASAAAAEEGKWGGIQSAPMASVFGYAEFWEMMLFCVTLRIVMVRFGVMMKAGSPCFRSPTYGDGTNIQRCPHVRRLTPLSPKPQHRSPRTTTARRAWRRSFLAQSH